MTSPGEKFRLALQKEKPLQLVGVINAYVALMAKHVGFHALYLSGAGIANSSYGLPDLGLTTLDNVLEDVNRITSTVDLPLVVDIDTGWGNALMIARTIKSMIRAQAAAVHIEDQVTNKRCGHRPKKMVVPIEEMIERIKAAVDAKTDSNFVIIARTDAYSLEGMEGAIKRAIAYQEAGADMIFPEALGSLEEYKHFKKALKIPILANLTEFGQSPLFTREELKQVGVDIALYPLTVNRAMNLAANKMLINIRENESQAPFLEEMQTREELYGYLDYLTHEQKIDQIHNKP